MIHSLPLQIGKLPSDNFPRPLPEHAGQSVLRSNMFGLALKKLPRALINKVTNFNKNDQVGHHLIIMKYLPVSCCFIVKGKLELHSSPCLFFDFHCCFYF
ncbi:hypothetical protein ATANTOWER_006047 [Ataeniobius toweri]|uniref:Uncharacterized protein n=1 Tax=Ataeniobius toweri TaxID=208326 RepID=A0ABU7C6K1_9TELE|nr:hypothetical protein [Ataeniobius toweri]